MREAQSNVLISIHPLFVYCLIMFNSYTGAVGFTSRMEQTYLWDIKLSQLAICNQYGIENKSKDS